MTRPPAHETAFWALCAAALVACLASGWWQVAAVGAACVALAGCLPLFSAASGLRFPFRLVVAVALFCAGALLWGELGDGYEAMPWWDLLLHVASCAVLAVAGVALALLPTAGARPRTAVWVISMLGFAFAMMVGACWEMLEYGLDTLFGLDTQDSGLDDTMTDVIANAVGAVLGAVAAQWALLRGARVPLGAMLLDWIALNPVIYGLWTGPFEQPRGRALAGEDGALQGRGQAG